MSIVEPERRQYLKLIFPASIRIGDTLRIMEWREARYGAKRKDDKPARWVPVWARVDAIHRFGKSFIVHYSRHGIDKGQRVYGTTIYYPTQYACRVIAYCNAQPDSPTA